jgi:hypothetical protein
MRRSRAHRAGDHSLCREQAPCRRPRPPRPSLGEGPRAVELKAAVESAAVLNPYERTLLVEACRLVDAGDAIADALDEQPDNTRLISTLGANAARLAALFERLPSADAAAGEGSGPRRGLTDDELDAFLASLDGDAR